MNRLFRSALLFGTFATGACSPDGGSRGGREESRVLMERVDVLQSDLERATSEARAAERSLRTVREDAVRREKEATTEREAYQKKLDDAVKALDEYKAKYRVTYRSKAAGRKMTQLDSGTGGIFEGVEILALTPGELRFHHNNGIATVALGQLKADLRESLGYDPQEAAAWLKEQRVKQVAAEEEEPAPLTASAKSRPKKAGFASGAKGLFLANLNNIYSQARALQADRNACPVHKRYQLSAWASEAARIKQKLAALP